MHTATDSNDTDMATTAAASDPVEADPSLARDSSNGGHTNTRREAERRVSYDGIDHDMRFMMRTPALACMCLFSQAGNSDSLLAAAAVCDKH
jgi:hypothetical protein